LFNKLRSGLSGVFSASGGRGLAGRLRGKQRESTHEGES